ncbi:aconitase family protein [Aspergillus campestris IBT 28561]|uniref:Aconitase family protein n=1 Tax=Aspergillus campestris (strain IBT 28561) TaxID=1392248 RepID=A0A2I1D8Q0_ASPC2|nr:aconitase family protein [Aspergillus campestris IBT 28561]PKY06246.1 aconitase family protein [Aspergillus campestris IBT 28561]
MISTGESLSNPHPQNNLLHHLQQTSESLQTKGHPREATTLTDVLAICTQSPELGGLGLSTTDELTPEQQSEIQFLASAWLESLNSADRSKSPLTPLSSRPRGQRAMTLSEKIFAVHDIQRRGCVAPGELICVDVDWVIASEASWAGMETTYTRLGQPGIFRNDRFWLVGDHVVDPRFNALPKVRALIDASERARRVFKMTDYQGMNYTILHTEFYRERAQPGMLVVGSDSHTCSSGALGCLAIGLGAADVTLPLVTGETWFKVPESVSIRLVGSPRPGIGGKDVILYILQQLKRNTVASERIVEFTGPGVKYLSSDARFAICNMTAEFGGITGLFVPDEETHAFVQGRRLPRHKQDSVYLKPDEDAHYAETCEIDLGEVRSFLSRYPRPDDVVPVADHEDMELDGCFIGACTTTEEDLILAALVLEQGFLQGLKPVRKGKRKVVPGSMPILRRLRELGLIELYEDAGFEIGVPGCSYCVGMSADQAGPGEVWLSSQNRNFENRMGRGSIGHLSSAATVAASSFGMKLRDPHDLLSAIDTQRWESLRRFRAASSVNSVVYVEPNGSDSQHLETPLSLESSQTVSTGGITHNATFTTQTLTGRIQRLGDFIDTDALAPAEFLMDMNTNEASGQHCLQYTHPDFRHRARQGFNIVVAGQAFGCGSSREQAVMALLGTGIQCIIAKSFTFIFQRNMPNLGLLGIVLQDESFYDVALDGRDISIDFVTNVFSVGGRNFAFRLSRMEKALFEHGGVASAFRRFGKRLFEVMAVERGLGGRDRAKVVQSGGAAGLEW